MAIYFCIVVAVLRYHGREWGIIHIYKGLLKFNITLSRSFKAVFNFYYIPMKSAKAIIRG